MKSTRLRYAPHVSLMFLVSSIIPVFMPKRNNFVDSPEIQCLIGSDAEQVYTSIDYSLSSQIERIKEDNTGCH